MYLDQRLSYDTHITKKVPSCFNQLVHINRIKHVLDRPTLLLLIKSFVFTKLFYCSSVWALLRLIYINSNWSKTLLRELFWDLKNSIILAVLSH